MNWLNFKKTAMLCLLISQTLAFAFVPVINGPLIQTYENKKYLNPLFDKKFLHELHALIQRSYNVSSRGRNEYDYLNLRLIENNMCWRFKNDRQREWFCHRPFIGTHGANSLGGLLTCCFCPPQKEIDYAGFVALKQATETTPPILMIVFRGSQGNRFQALKGHAGPSWLTNWNSGKMAFPYKFLGYDATFHTGYLEKYLSLKLSLFGDIGEMLSLIPFEERHRLVVVITGHSQGAGVVQPASLDIISHWGPRIFGKGFSNISSPHFFLYALSGPNVVGDDTTKQLYYRIVGKDNIVRHSSVFDIVTYACLGQKYESKWLLNLFLQGLFGVETGFRHVGHLAIDDVRCLLSRGFKANGQQEYLTNLDQIVTHLTDGYQYYLKAHQDYWWIMRRIDKIRAIISYQKAFNLMGGIGNFVALQHYGSLRPKYKKGQTTLSYGFNPTMPSVRLSLALERGEQHRLATKNIVPYSQAGGILCSLPRGKVMPSNPSTEDTPEGLPDVEMNLLSDERISLAKN